MKCDRQSKCHSHQPVSKFWIPKSHTTRNGSQLRSSRRSRRVKEKWQKSTTAVHKQKKASVSCKQDSIKADKRESIHDRQAPQDPLDNPSANEDLQIDCDLPNIPGHQTLEEQQVSKTWQHPSTGNENGYRNEFEAILSALQGDMGRGTCPIRMEGRLPY